MPLPYKIRNRILNLLYERRKEVDNAPMGSVPFQHKYMDERQITELAELTEKEVETNCQWLKINGYIKHVEDLEGNEYYRANYSHYEVLDYFGFALTDAGMARLSSPFTKNYKPEMDKLAVRGSTSSFWKNIVFIIGAVSGWIAFFYVNWQKVMQFFNDYWFI